MKRYSSMYKDHMRTKTYPHYMRLENLSDLHSIPITIAISILAIPY